MGNPHPAGAARTVLVTGGASGIGKGTAAAFRALGDDVLVADVAVEAGRKAAAELGAEYLEVDIGDKASVAAAVAGLERQSRRVDVLVNNAGVAGGGGPLVELPVEVFDTCVRINLRGTFLMTRAFGAHMRRHQVKGAIVNIS